jgi:hypothetical protein
VNLVARQPAVVSHQSPQPASLSRWRLPRAGTDRALPGYRLPPMTSTAQSDLSQIQPGQICGRPSRRAPGGPERRGLEENPSTLRTFVPARHPPAAGARAVVYWAPGIPPLVPLPRSPSPPDPARHSRPGGSRPFDDATYRSTAKQCQGRPAAAPMPTARARRPELPARSSPGRSGSLAAKRLCRDAVSSPPLNRAGQRPRGAPAHESHRPGKTGSRRPLPAGRGPDLAPRRPRRRVTPGRDYLTRYKAGSGW